MAGAMVGGAAVEAIFGESLSRAINMVDKALKFKTTREELRSTLQHLSPIIQQMKAYDERLDRPLDQIERVMEEFQKSDTLVRKSSKVRWFKYLSLPFLHDKLQERDRKLVRAVTVDVQLLMAKDVKETLEILSDVKEILQNFVDNRGLSSNATILRGLCRAPENPEYTVGLDGPLKKTKIELLKGGASVVVLTGLLGSGKTTMAKKLCWDPDVRGKFRDNIFFVTFSKTPNLKSIVQTLFEYCGLQAPEFSSDEDAIHRLEYLLKQFGGRPILLVLDDVWRGSETLVEKFRLKQLKLSDYKVLVTSRFVFPRFLTSCCLEPLDHDDAVKLFRHFSLLNDSSSYTPDEKLVHQVVRGCKGSPLAIEVIGGLLCKQPFEIWQKMKDLLLGQSIYSNTDLLHRIQSSLEILEPNKKECFMDLGLFPEDEMIPVDGLIDIWAERYELDGDGKEAMAIIHELTASNLAKTVVRRKVASDADKYYNSHFVMLHDLLRDLAIHQSKQVPFEERSRLIVDFSENDHPKRDPEQQQQGVIGRMLSIFPGWWTQQKQQQVIARTLSV